jgi:hypothetical protein
MLTDETTYLIEKNPVRPDAENYPLLRSLGIEHIQKLSNKIWTDYNVHDPGITILELLCYALTDLGYRTSFDMNDLLTSKGKDTVDTDKTFYRAKDILTSHPITINDYRRYIIDKIPGIRNVWMEILDEEIYDPFIYYDPKLKQLSLKYPGAGSEKLDLSGLYRVKIELHEFELFSDQFANEDAFKKDCLTKTKTALLSKRNLCEDFKQIKIVTDEFVAMCLDVELTPDANTDEVYKAIYKQAYNYINPSIPIYTLEELLNKGKTMEEIFEGTVAERGFIDLNELAKFEHRNTLYVSDLINLLMDIKGVQAIRDIHLNSYTQTSPGIYTLLKQGEKFSLDLTDTKNASFRFRLDVFEKPKDKLNKITFRKGPIYFTPSLTDSDNKIEGIIGSLRTIADFKNDLPVPTGRNRNLDEYISIQDEFPKAYQIGKEGIADAASPLRKAQRLQLKGYLIFFDQLLADYLSQLAKTKDLLSWKGDSTTPTYYYNALSENEIRDFNVLFTNYSTYPAKLEDKALLENRRNRFLDHLLARFNEKFVDYSVFKFTSASTGIAYNSFSDAEKINDKISFLESYPVISSDRSHAFDYSKDASDLNQTVLEKRICKILGIDVPNKKLATGITDNKGILLKDAKGKPRFCDNRFDPFDKTFGFHIVEHILLRPHDSDLTQTLLQICSDGTVVNSDDDCICANTYSMRMTVLVPGWLAICNRMEFRRFIEQQIRLEAPAHAALKICWLNPIKMFEFETNYKLFLEALRKFSQSDNPNPPTKKQHREALSSLNQTMNTLHNMYPASQLDSCDSLEFGSDGNLLENPVILGRTSLGSGNPPYVFEKCVVEEVPMKLVKEVIKNKIVAPKAVKKIIKTPAKKVKPLIVKRAKPRTVKSKTRTAVKKKKSVSASKKIKTAKKIKTPIKKKNKQ